MKYLGFWEIFAKKMERDSKTPTNIEKDKENKKDDQKNKEKKEN